MVRLRAAKIAGIATDIPPVDLDADDGAELLLVSWGGTWGAATAATRRIRARGLPIAHAHLTHLSPFPADLGDIVRRYRDDPRSRAEPRAALAVAAGRVPRGRAELHAGARQPVQGRRSRSEDPGVDASTSERTADGNGERRRPVKLARKDFQSDQEVRWCPGLRRLRHPRRDPVHAARHRDQARRAGVRLRHRLRGALAVLHEHVRPARDPRPRAGDRDRRRAGPPRSARVGHRRRRRHAVDRRQPPHPRAAPQRQHQDPDVEQPDLRPDEGPVLADQRARQGHQEHAVRFARPAVQPDLGRVGRRGVVRRPHPRHGPQAHDRDVPAGQRAPRARRSSRSTRTATSSTTARSTRSSTRTRARTCSSS